MNNSTICSLEDKLSQHKKTRCTQVSTYSNDLKFIKLRLRNISNNTIQMGSTDLGRLRRQYYRLSLMRDIFSLKDHEESAEIRKLFAKLKQTHPEISAEKEFAKSEEIRSFSQPMSAEFRSFSQPNSSKAQTPSTLSNPNQSRNMLSSFVYQSSPNPPKQAPEVSVQEQQNKSDSSIESSASQESFCDSPLFSTQNMRESAQTPVADDTQFEEDDVETSLQKLQHWATELHEALEKQYPGR